MESSSNSGESDSGLPATGSPTDEHAERFVPETMGGLIKAEHEARYRWAASVVEHKNVLDAGCGVGYGMGILKDAGATRVVGIDRSAEAIEGARERLGAMAELVVGDIHELPFESASFDVVICFEVIEHVDRPGAALDELRRVLRSEGLLVISTPNRLTYVSGNPHHVHEFLPDEFQEALSQRFRQVVLYRQHPWLASLISNDRGAAEENSAVELGASLRKVAGVMPGEELYTIAVAGETRLSELMAVAVLGDPVDIKAWQSRVTDLEQQIGMLEEQRVLLAYERDALRKRTIELTEQIDRLRESLSWRVTAPLRSLRRQFGKAAARDRSERVRR